MKELKEALRFGISFLNAIGKSTEDFKLSASDALNFWETLTLAGDAIEGAEKIKAEVEAMDEASKAELVEWAKDEFDIPQDGIESAIESGLDMVMTIVKYISKR